jgi:hypothetical protein
MVHMSAGTACTILIGCSSVHAGKQDRRSLSKQSAPPITSNVQPTKRRVMFKRPHHGRGSGRKPHPPAVVPLTIDWWPSGWQERTVFGNFEETRSARRSHCVVRRHEQRTGRQHQSHANRLGQDAVRVDSLTEDAHDGIFETPAAEALNSTHNRRLHPMFVGHLRKPIHAMSVIPQYQPSISNACPAAITPQTTGVHGAQHGTKDAHGFHR